MIRIAVLGCGRIGVMHAANVTARPARFAVETALKSIAKARVVAVKEIA